MSKEQCSKCGATDFCVARDMTSRRMCSCGNSWDCQPTTPANAAAKKPREFWIDDVSSDSWYKKAAVHYDDTEKFIGRTVHVIEASYAKELETEIERLKKLLASYQHNHFTRDIKEKGVCPSCDRYHEKQERKSLTEKLAVAEAALEFYADSNNYSHFPATSDPECSHFVGFVEEASPGDTAREALASIRGNKNG